MNKTHEKYYIPLNELKKNEEEFNYRCFCAVFDDYARIRRHDRHELDFLKEMSKPDIQHDLHMNAIKYNIDRGDFAKVNNLEGCNSWYDMVVEYRSRLSPRELYIDKRYY